MRRIFFLGAAGLALVGLRPTGDRLWSAFPRSTPRPELEAYFRACVERGERPAPSLLQIARIRRAAGDREGEVGVRERLATLEPADWENLQELARVYVWDQRPDEAFGAVERMLLAVPHRLEARLAAVELAEACGRPDAALPHAWWLVGRRAKHPALVRLFVAARSLEGILAAAADPLERARALVATGLREGQALAIEEYLDHVDRRPGDLAARGELADVLAWNDRPLDAAGQWEHIVRASGDEGARRKLLALYRAIHRIDLLLPHLPEGEERAEVLSALGRIDEARAAWEKLGRLDKVLELAIGAPLEDEELGVRERMAPTRENRERLAALYAWRRDLRRALALYEELDHERAVDLHLALGDIASAILAAERLGLHARLGDLYVQVGEYEKAIAAFRKVPGEERELARLLVLVGRPGEAVDVLDAMSGQEYVRAELYLYAKRGDRALRVLSALPPAELDLGRLVRLARAADAATAEALCRRVLDRSPDDVAALRLLADLHEWAGRPAELEAVLRRLAALEPDDPGLLARLGLVARDRSLLERAWDLGARDPRILRALADIAVLERRKEDAIALLRRYLALRPEDFEAQFALAELTRDPADYARTWAVLPPDEMRIRARLLMHEGRLAEAEALLKAAGDTEALADLYLRTGRLEEAEKLPLTPRQKADLAVRRGRHEEAVAILKTLDLRDPDIRRALAESLAALGRYDEAEALLPGVSVRPRAVVAMREGRWADALALLETLDPADPDVLRAKADCLVQLGRFDEADALVPGISLRPRALLAMKEGRWADALALLEAIDPADKDVVLARAECLARLDRFDEADALVPGLGTRFRALAALQRGDLALAVELLKRLDLEDPDVRSSLVHALLGLGRWQEAEDYATPELRREIRARYGPEGSLAARVDERSSEQILSAAARWRMPLSEKVSVRAEAQLFRIDGPVAGEAEERTQELEAARLFLMYGPSPGLAFEAGAGGWTGEAASRPYGSAGVLAGGSAWRGRLSLDAAAPWTDSAEAVAAGGMRHRGGVELTLTPFRFLVLHAAAERGRMELTEAPSGVSDGPIDETRLRARAEIRFWTGEGSVGRGFYDAELREEGGLASHLGLAVQTDHARLEGPDDAVAYVQLLPESRAYTVGPTAAWATEAVGVWASGFVGADPARDLDFARLWGASAGAVLVFSDAWKFSVSGDYVSESRQAEGGSSWGVFVGLHHNF